LKVLQDLIFGISFQINTPIYEYLLQVHGWKCWKIWFWNFFSDWYT